MNQKRILLVDDHQLIIDGLRGFIESVPQYQVIGEANNGNEAIRLTAVLNPDLILMDIEMPGTSGIQACEEIKRVKPDQKIIIVSMHDESQLVKKLIALGADGYLLKNSGKEIVLEAIEFVLGGGRYFDPELLNSSKQSTIGQSNPDIDLTEREIEILQHLAQGLTNKEIGDTLNISHRTVDTHRTNLMRKLQVTNVAGLIRYAFQHKLIQ